MAATRDTADEAANWPALPLDSWQPTCDTLHLWTQMVGKVRLALTPRLNHWWNVPLYVSARGLTSSAIPYGGSAFELEFDFVDHQLRLRKTGAAPLALALAPQTVAEFYHEFLVLLQRAGIAVKIWPMPVEVVQPVRFDQDEIHAAYDRTAVEKFHRILLSSAAVLERFRCGFVGKCSPVHFFWGSFDLAVTRFSGRRAPERPGADAITREAYSHEVASVGFWPGMGVGEAAYYAYAAPAPEGFGAARVLPAAAHWDANLGEFLVAYDAIRTAASPTAALRAFCDSTYNASADLGKWDRTALERMPN